MLQRATSYYLCHRRNGPRLLQLHRFFFAFVKTKRVSRHTFTTVPMSSVGYEACPWGHFNARQ